jgi:chromosome segregation ATPase
MSTESILDNIRQDAQKALIRNAFFRLESALVLAGTIALSVFNPFLLWPWWVWTLLGLVAEAAVVISSLTDKGEMRKVMESLFREKYSTAGIRDRELRGKLDEAEQYRLRIQQVVDQTASGLLRDRIAETTAQIYDWIANMVRLARRIDTYRQDTILRRDIQEVPKEIRDLSARLRLETNPQVRQQMEATLSSRQQLAENLQELESRMERADLQLDHSLASLGTVYSQLLLIGSKDVDSDRAERLRGDIRDEVSALQDLVESLNEVYSGGFEPSERAAKPLTLKGRST